MSPAHPDVAVTADHLVHRSPEGEQKVPWRAVRSVEVLAVDGDPAHPEPSWWLALDAVEVHRAPAAATPALRERAEALGHQGWLIPLGPARWRRTEVLREARRAWARAA